MKHYLLAFGPASIVALIFIIRWWIIFPEYVKEGLSFKDTIPANIVVWGFHILPIVTLILILFK